MADETDLPNLDVQPPSSAQSHHPAADAGGSVSQETRNPRKCFTADGGGSVTAGVVVVNVDEEEEDSEEEEDEMVETGANSSWKKRKRDLGQNSSGKGKTQQFDSTPRKLVRSPVLNTDFLIQNGLSEIHETLSHQKGLLELFDKQCTVDEKYVKEFYQNLLIEGKNILAARFSIGDVRACFSSFTFGKMINIQSGDGFSGLDELQCPKDVHPNVIKRLVSKGNTKWNKLDVFPRVLLYIVQNLILPRERMEDPTVADFMILYHLISKTPIDFPALFMKHMRHARVSPIHGLPYPGLVKEIMKSKGLYTDDEGDEKLVSFDFDDDTLRKLGLVKSGSSWIVDEVSGPPDPPTLGFILEEVSCLRTTIDHVATSQEKLKKDQEKSMENQEKMMRMVRKLIDNEKRPST